ncbi:MAG TPA: AmmeMemoRadiSam system protein B [Rhizobiales bacterium]|nr:AmmeMemoRadiSam system protein B [Hyphomicrobiales bacterium]
MTVRLIAGLLAAALAVGAACARAKAASPDCPAQGEDYPPFYRDAGLFEAAIAKVAGHEPSNVKLSGVTVPHHLLADRLVALGMKTASGFGYKRIVILSPDHFRRATKPFATTTRGFRTVLGRVGTDAEAVGRLLGASDLVEESCLFDRDHGVRALLPFVHNYFPDAMVVPVAISIRTRRADWDALAEALAPLLDDDTLVLESTDFSHYLPHHAARLRDQQTLNVIASRSLDQLVGLVQPEHLDSLGALYLQMRLQDEAYGAEPLVIANDNAQQYEAKPSDSTTSYMVILFGRFGPDFNDPVPDNGAVYYLAGDTNFGRSMKRALLDAEAADRVASAVLARTKGRPLVVNLEGVILPNVPQALDDMTLAMPEDLTVAWLKWLNVVGAGLANNHAMDLGPSGYAETTRALDAAGIRWFGQGEALELPGVDIVGLSDLDTNGSPQVDLITEALLDRLIREDGARPVVAYVHWGREYLAEPSDREKALADAMRLRSATVIVGAHPHVASAGIATHGGGDTTEVYSLGNFLFDQTAGRGSSGQLVELRVFDQGTVFVRTLELPNLFDLARP